MIAPKRIEIRWRDLAAAFFGGFLGPARQEAARRVEGALFPPEEGLSVLSVRSGFDLLLSALQLPRGSEILVSAVTIEDMTRIIREHGLVPVPVDLDMESLSLPAAAVEAAVTDRTRAILAAHLFGSRMPLADVAEVARAKGLLLIEDCAQAFDGSRHAGSEHSDVAMYSFGPIKTLTALGGGVLRVRSPELLATMRRIHEAWPCQSRRAYLMRVVKYAGVCLLLTPRLYGAFARVTRGRHQEVLKAAVRGFPGPELFRRIRRRPSTPLLATMARRLRNGTTRYVDRRRARGEQVTRALGGLRRPGSAAADHSYWVFPVEVSDPDRTIRSLRALGIDASRGTTSLTVVQPPPGEGRPAAPAALETMDRVVFLPVYPEVPDRDLHRLIDTMTRLEDPAHARI